MLGNQWDALNGGNSDDIFTQYSFDPRGNNELGTMFQQYGAGLYGDAARRFGFASSLQPQWEQSVMGLLGQMTPEAVNTDIANYSAGAQENAAEAARNAAMFGSATGVGDGTVAGQQAGGFNKAAAQSNAYRAQQNSPEARLQRFSAIMQAINAGSGNPFFQQQMGLFGPIEQRHQQNRSEIGSGSMAGTLGTLAGMYMGQPGAFSGLFGGGGGGGQAWNNPFDGGNGAGVPF
jgi:hypothetical protein